MIQMRESGQASAVMAQWDDGHTNFVSWMPRHAFNILCMVHQDGQTFKLAIGVDCIAQKSASPTQHKQRKSPSHTQTVLSRLQLAKSVPVFEYATPLHSVSCPSSVLIHSHSASLITLCSSSSSSKSCSQTATCESNDPVARVFPDGAQAIERTVLVCPVEMVLRCLNFRSAVGCDG